VGTVSNYPAKPVRIITGEPGGSNDFAARLIVQGISGPLGQPVIVENRTASFAADYVAGGAADGYTLLYAGTPLWISPLLRKTNYDPIKDYAPVTLVLTAPSVLAVHPSLPAKSVKDLIALAKAKPGALNYGSSGVGTANHLAVELFKSMAGVEIMHIPYKGGGPSMIALLGNEVQLMFITAGSIAPHLKSDKLRALAVASAEPFALVPGLPTVASSGLPGYESGSIQGVFAPAKTPVGVIRRLNREIVQVLRATDVKDKLLSTGSQAVGSSPEEFSAKIKSEITRLGKVIKEKGIRE
jgi:tripartite-type tricarboxylate transporter receptor subunit TctC